MSEQAISQEFKILETGSAFISKNAKEFGEKYPKNFIAVYDNNLVAVEKDFDKLKEKIEEKNVNIGLVLIEYMPGPDDIILY